MSLTIRRATPADVGVLVEFNLAIAWETEHKRLNRDVLSAGVRSLFADSTRGFYTVAESGGVYGEDPAFAGADDRHVGSTSPASGAGTELGAVTADLDGDCYASPPSIGAYEAQISP